MTGSAGSKPGLTDDPSDAEIKGALDELVRVGILWELGGQERGNGKKGMWIVRLFDVTKTDRLTVGYAFIEGKKYRVIIPSRSQGGVATRVPNRSRRTWDMERAGPGHCSHLGDHKPS